MQAVVIHWFGQHWAKVVLAALLGALAAVVAVTALTSGSMPTAEGG